MSNTQASNLKKYKIVFLGDQSVGKTSIINQFIYGTFDHSHQPTIGIDFLSKTMYLDNQTIRLQLWDTAGQERFRSLIPNYVRDCTAAIVVYDITKEESFLNLDRWIQDVREESGENTIIILAGNKTDLADKRAVALEEAQKKASINGAMFREVSAKTGENVKSLFSSLTQELPGVQESLAASSPEFGGTQFRLQDKALQETQEQKCKC